MKLKGITTIPLLMTRLDFGGQRSKVKGQGHSSPSMWQRHPRRRWFVEVHLSVYVGNGAIKEY